MNKVKICQTVCSSLKQKKFAEKQRKLSCSDVTSSFTNLKSSLCISIKLVQSFEILVYQILTFSWSIQHNLVWVKEPTSISNLWFTLNLSILIHMVTQ